MWHLPDPPPPPGWPSWMLFNLVLFVICSLRFATTTRIHSFSFLFQFSISPLVCSHQIFFWIKIPVFSFRLLSRWFIIPCLTDPNPIMHSPSMRIRMKWIQQFLPNGAWRAFEGAATWNEYLRHLGLSTVCSLFPFEAFAKLTSVLFYF